MVKNTQKTKKLNQKIDLDEDDYANFYNLVTGVYHPEKTFFTESKYQKFLKDDKNKSTIPILLYVDKSFKFFKNKKSKLIFNNNIIGQIENNEIFKINKQKLIKKTFGFNNSSHPIIKKLKNKNPFCISGKLYNQKEKLNNKLLKFRELYKGRFKNSVGFSSRNIPHFGHELIIKSLISKKFKNIFIIYINSNLNKISFNLFKKSYQIISKKLNQKFYFINLYLPSFKAGPNEALFQAKILKHIGLKNFSVGRDHAGISNFYKKYETQNYLKNIKIKNFSFIFNNEPVRCLTCNKIFFLNEKKNKKNCCSNEYSSFSGTENNLLIKNRKFDKLKKFIDKDILELIKNKNF